MPRSGLHPPRLLCSVRHCHGCSKSTGCGFKSTRAGEIEAVSHTASGEAHDTEDGKHDRGGDADGSNSKPVGYPVANDNRRDVRQHHAECRPDDHRIKQLEARGETDCRYLCLVADLGEKEGNEGRRKRPCAADCLAVALVLSGNSAQTAMLRKEIPRIQRIDGPVIKPPKKIPTRPAAAWLASVAKKMPKMIGSGRRKRADSIKDRICVLSPISARPTTMVETRNASMEQPSGSGGTWTLARTPPPNPGAGEPMPKVSPNLPGRLRHGRS